MRRRATAGGAESAWRSDQFADGRVAYEGSGADVGPVESSGAELVEVTVRSLVDPPRVSVPLGTPDAVPVDVDAPDGSDGAEDGSWVAEWVGECVVGVGDGLGRTPAFCLGPLADGEPPEGVAGGLLEGEVLGVVGEPACEPPPLEPEPGWLAPPPEAVIGGALVSPRGSMSSTVDEVDEVDEAAAVSETAVEVAVGEGTGATGPPGTDEVVDVVDVSSVETPEDGMPSAVVSAVPANSEGMPVAVRPGVFAARTSAWSTRVSRASTLATAVGLGLAPRFCCHARRI